MNYIALVLNGVSFGFMHTRMGHNDNTVQVNKLYPHTTGKVLLSLNKIFLCQFKPSARVAENKLTFAVTFINENCTITDNFLFPITTITLDIKGWGDYVVVCPGYVHILIQFN